MRVNVSAIIVHRNKALIIRRGLDREYFPGMWATAGGGMEKRDKTLQDATRREVMEELGIEVDVSGLVQNNYDEADDILYLKFLATLRDPDDFLNDLTISEELHSYEWVDESGLENRDFTPHTKKYVREA